MAEAPVTWLAIVYIDPPWAAWSSTSLLFRVSPAFSVTESTPRRDRSASSRSPGTFALKPWKTENCWPTEPPKASTARSGPFPVPAVSWTMTETRSAVDGVAASATDAIAGPATPAARKAAVATVATLRACRGSPPHVTPREREAEASPRLSTTCTSVCWLQCLRDGLRHSGGQAVGTRVADGTPLHPSGGPAPTFWGARAPAITLR